MPLQTKWPGFTIKEWCDVNGHGSVARLARRSGLSWRQVRNLRDQKTKATAKMAVAIEYATGGQIRAETVLELGRLRNQAERILGPIKEMEEFQGRA